MSKEQVKNEYKIMLTKIDQHENIHAQTGQHHESSTHSRSIKTEFLNSSTPSQNQLYESQRATTADDSEARELELSSNSSSTAIELGNSQLDHDTVTTS